MVEQQFRILAENNDWIALDKPAGFHVHSPETQTHRISTRKNLLFWLKSVRGQTVAPLHRIDVATSGVVLFSKNPQSAAHLQTLWTQRQIRKIYYALVRGWPNDLGTIHRSLKNSETQNLEDAETHYRVVACGQREQGSLENRYALLRIELITGRRHQIRRHLRGIGHPILGDTLYGDTNQNKRFTEIQGTRRLALKAYALQWNQGSGDFIRIHSRWDSFWHRIFDELGSCPFESFEPIDLVNSI